MNALAGFQRAIVSDMPGTTRDVVTLTTAIDGWPVQLSDTAGLRKAGDPLEAAGIERASKSIAAADLVIKVRDCTAKENDSASVLEAVTGGLGSSRMLEVLNKIDLLPAEPGTPSSSSRLLYTSAATGVGIPNLIAAIGEALVPNPPPAGAAVPFEAEHCVALERARAAIADRDAKAACESLAAMMVPRRPMP
jgi:tRNA modification GTPase